MCMREKEREKGFLYELIMMKMIKLDINGVMIKNSFNNTVIMMILKIIILMMSIIWTSVNFI